MTDFGVFGTCAKRVHGMYMILAVVLGSSGAAQAGAWEEFERRCLMPMEDIALAQPGDLTPLSTSKNDGDTYSDYGFEDGPHILSVSDGRSGHAHWCTVGVESEGVEPSAEIANKFLNWSSQLGFEDRYEEVVSQEGALVLRSTTWREPKMDVKMLMLPAGPGIFLSVEETDLES